MTTEPTRAEMADDLIAAITVRPGGEGGFEADAPDWFGDRLFGGIVVAQALSAAIHSVRRGGGLRPHSLHGYFLRPQRPGTPITLAVAPVRAGRTFTTVEVTSSQDGQAAFRAMVSFHADEAGDEYQLPMASDLGDPDAMAEVDDDWGPGPWESRELGATPPGADGTYASTRRAWFRLGGTIPDDPDVHACLLAFLSDVTGTSFRPHNLGEWGTHTDASIDHAVWFHRPPRADGWLHYDLHALVNAGGRSLVRGALYTRDGQLSLSIAQELLIRPLVGPSP